MAYPKFFKPSAVSDLVRIGSPHDGGYVLPQRVLSNTQSLVSMGLCDDWSFEEAFQEESGAPLVVFDHSVDRKFWVRRFVSMNFRGLLELDLAKLKRAWRFVGYRRFFDTDVRRHVRRAIGRSEHGFVSLEDSLKIANFEKDIFLKIDIEGAEYRILEQIVENRHKLSGLAIEFHDVDIHEEKIGAFLNAMKKDFVLVHFHPNNSKVFGVEQFCPAVEISLMPTRLLQEGEQPKFEALPLAGVDAPNAAGTLSPAVQFRST